MLGEEILKEKIIEGVQEKIEGLIEEPEIPEEGKEETEKKEQQRPPNKSINQPQKTTEIKLLNQGTYGCIFRPEIKCDDGTVGSIKYISKIQKRDDNINYELFVSSKIKEIHNYYFYYAILLNDCNAILTSIPESQLKQCKVLDSIPVDSKKETKYISTKIRYVGEHSLEKYLKILYLSKQNADKSPSLQSGEYSIASRSSNVRRFSNLSSQFFEEKIKHTYQFLLFSLNKLNTHGVIHNDIKENNIMIDDNTRCPVLIDFNLSFLISDIQKPDAGELDEKPMLEKLNRMFFYSEFYLYYGIEFYMLVYIVNEIFNANTSEKEKMSKTSPINTEKIKIIIELFFINLYNKSNDYKFYLFDKISDSTESNPDAQDKKKVVNIINIKDLMLLRCLTT